MALHGNGKCMRLLCVTSAYDVCVSLDGGSVGSEIALEATLPGIALARV